MNTVRSYYRNSVLAFPKTVEYSCAIELPPQHIADRAVTITLIIAAVVVLLSICFQGAMK